MVAGISYRDHFHHAGQVYFVMVEKGYLTDEIPAEEMREPEKATFRIACRQRILEKGHGRDQCYV
jgi:hypothetical protein